VTVKAGDCGAEEQFTGPGSQVTNVITEELGRALTLPSALRVAMNVTYCVPAPNVNWLLPDGRTTDHVAALSGLVSSRVETDG
jgi:hypothetical protein